MYGDVSTAITSVTAVEGQQWSQCVLRGMTSTVIHQYMTSSCTTMRQCQLAQPTMHEHFAFAASIAAWLTEEVAVEA
eukprot:14348-Heterococcus_DN1.PRE.2